MNHCFVTVYLQENSSLGTANKIAELLIQTPKPSNDTLDVAVDALVDLGVIIKPKSKKVPCEGLVRAGPCPNGNVAPDWEKGESTVWILSSSSPPQRKPVNTQSAPIGADRKTQFVGIGSN